MIHGPKAAVMTCHGPALSVDKSLTAEFGALYDHHQHRLIFPEDYLSKVVAINLDLIADKVTIILIISYMHDFALVDATFTSYFIPHSLCIL